MSRSKVILCNLLISCVIFFVFFIPVYLVNIRPFVEKHKNNFEAHCVSNVTDIKDYTFNVTTIIDNTPINFHIVSDADNFNSDLISHTCNGLCTVKNDISDYYCGPIGPNWDKNFLWLLIPVGIISVAIPILAGVCYEEW